MMIEKSHDWKHFEGKIQSKENWWEEGPEPIESKNH